MRTQFPNPDIKNETRKISSREEFTFICFAGRNPNDLTLPLEYWNRFYVDRVPIRVYMNSDKPNNFFPNEKPMYLFSSIWNADDWATRGGLEKTNWTKAPFVSSYKDFSVDACEWEDPYPKCVSTTTENWWDQYEAWHQSESQKMDYAWVQRNLVIYDYCKDTERFPTLPWECSLSPWD